MCYEAGDNASGVDVDRIVVGTDLRERSAAAVAMAAELARKR